MRQNNKKSPVFPKFFIVRFPDNHELLLKSKNSWKGILPYTKYFNESFDDNILVVAVRWWEALKFIITGKVF